MNNQAGNAKSYSDQPCQSQVTQEQKSIPHTLRLRPSATSKYQTRLTPSSTDFVSCSNNSSVNANTQLDQHLLATKYPNFKPIQRRNKAHPLSAMAIPFNESNPQDCEQGYRSSVSSAGKNKILWQQQNDSSDSFKKNSSTNRFVLFIQKRISASNVSKCVMGLILTTIVVHRIASTVMTRRKWINAPITYIQRTCPAPQYERMSAQQASALKICLTSLTDAKSPSTFQRFIRWRNFDGILDLTWPNKQEYASKHGYHLFDQSHLIDTSRPPAWSKILAVKDLLSDKHKCDWVVWTDADTLIMNSEIKITDFLPADNKYDMLVASDKGWGYNSGVFLFRNTPWSMQLLDEWWNMKSFVRPPGFSLSGDNAAMKHLLMNMQDFDEHVLVPPRCTFNSFAKFLTLGQSVHVMDKIEQQEWYLDNEHYHKGDFIAHTPGVDNKAEAIQLLLDELSNQEKFDALKLL